MSSPEFPRISFSYIKNKQKPQEANNEAGERKQTATKQKRKKKRKRRETKTFFFFVTFLFSALFLAGFSCRFGFHFSEQQARCVAVASAALGEGETAAGKPSQERGGGEGDLLCSESRSETTPLRPRQCRPGPGSASGSSARRLSLAPFHQHRSPVTWSRPGREAGNTHTTHTPFLQYFGCLPHGNLEESRS